MSIQNNKGLILLFMAFGLGSYLISNVTIPQAQFQSKAKTFSTPSPDKFNLISLENNGSCYQFMTSRTGDLSITSLHCNLNSVVGKLQDIDRPSEVGKTNSIELAKQSLGPAFLVVFEDESKQKILSIPIIINKVVDNGADYSLVDPIKYSLAVGMSGAPIVQNGEVVGTQSGISLKPEDLKFDPLKPDLKFSKVGFMTNHTPPKTNSSPNQEPKK
jgi:hypothetical protein